LQPLFNWFANDLIVVPAQAPLTWCPLCNVWTNLITKTGFCVWWTLQIFTSVTFGLKTERGIVEGKRSISADGALRLERYFRKRSARVVWSSSIFWLAYWL
jgi:hypothetical protein